MSASMASMSSELCEPQVHSPQPTSVADLLLRAAQRHPRSGIRVISTEREHAVLLTYRGVLDEARRILGGLQSHGRRPGEKVALLLERAEDFIPAFWACVLGGYIPCPLTPIRNDPERSARHLAYLDTLLDRPLLIATASLNRELSGMEAADLESLRTGLPQEGSYQPRLDDPAVIMLTSGSTGNSKAVVLTNGNILASMTGKSGCRRLTDTDIALNWVPFDHVTALVESHIMAVYAGATWLHVDAALILADPLLLLRLIDRYRVSTTLVPNFLIGQINAALEPPSSTGAKQRPASCDLSSLRHIITGGEANVVETGRQFLNLLARYGLARNVLWPGFGMTETCAGVAYSQEFPDVDMEREFASVGFPVSGFQMRIVDERSAVLPAGESGELQLRGPMVFSRYHNNEEATHTAFTADGWLRTGDVARIEEGRLQLVGRNKDCIIVSGVNYFSHELESVLEQLDGIERSFVAAFATRPHGADTEQLVVCFTPSFPLEDEARLHQLTVAVRNTTILLWGFRPALILPLPKSAFPKTSLGKIQRSLMRKRLEGRQLAAHQAHIASVTSRQLGGYTAPEGAIEAAITEIYAEMFGLEPTSVSTTASFFDLGGTSLDIVKLSQRLEQLFGIPDVPITTILQNPSVRALAGRVAPGKQQEKIEYDPIVPLQLTGRKTPLFCIHPASGEVLVFVSLANYFVNDRPFFALRARGFNQGEKYFATFDEMVSAYVDAIRKRQPHGPYALAGYSFGGPVAFEVAKVLESQGERIAFVGSIDMPPRIPYALDLVDVAVGFALFLSLIDKKQLLELPNEIRAAGHDPYAYLIQLAPPDRLAELDLDLPKFKAWTALTYSLVSTILSYAPCGSVESITVFCAHPLWNTEEGWLSELKQWDSFARAPNHYVHVAGEHHTLMDPKYVASFQAVLRAELDRALDGE